jgi:hypothetical protein
MGEEQARGAEPALNEVKGAVAPADPL